MSAPFTPEQPAADAWGDGWDFHSSALREGEHRSPLPQLRDVGAQLHQDAGDQ